MNTVTESKITQFAQLINDGIEAWVKAGEIVVELLDADPQAMDNICAQCPWITPEIIVRFEQIGRKQVYPKLLLSDAPGVRKLRKLSYSLQGKYSEEPVDLLVVNNGSTDVLKVHVKSLTSSQANQVFDKDCVRSVAQQRAFIFDKNSSTVFPDLSESLPYRIRGGKVEFRENCTLTAHQIAEILTRLQ